MSSKTSEEIAAAFKRKLRANPYLLDWAIGLTESLIAEGGYVSMRYVFERLRVIPPARIDGERFALNNSFAAPMGRVIKLLRPDLAEHIKTRRSAFDALITKEFIEDLTNAEEQQQP